MWRKKHFKCCKSTKKIHTVDDLVGITDGEGVLYLDSVMVDSVTADWIEPLSISSCIMPFKLDTGAQANIISEEGVKLLKKII